MRILILLLCAALVLPLRGDQTDASKLLKLDESVAGLHVAPGPNDSRISTLTGELLERAHYLHEPLDSTIAKRFMDHYLDTLDPQHIHFLQSDVEEFDAYIPMLRDLTINRGDAAPAYLVFDRFMQRLEQRCKYYEELLKDAPFDYTTDEKIMSNRKDQPFPKDMDEARQLWRQRVRYEYLQERLAKEGREDVTRLIASRSNAVSTAMIWHDFNSDIVTTITRRNSRTVRFFKEWDNEKVLETYLTALAHSYDPRSDYMDKSDLENFSISMSLSLFGIGAVLTSEDGYCKINDLNPSGPAAKSKKLKPKDKIVAVGQGDAEMVDVVDMPLNKVVELIRGPKGTEVRLTIIPAADTTTRKTISLIRDEIKLEDQQAKAKIIDLTDDEGRKHRIGVIDLPSFYASFPLVGSTDTAEIKSATTDTAKLLAKLKQENVSGMILDLRRNPGGSLEEAITLTGLFIKNGPVVQTRDQDGRVHVGEDKDPQTQYDGPLVLLTSKLSASASEILAGALQDYGRAVLVGDSSTHGKGTVQRMTQLAPFIFNTRFGLSPTNDPASLGALKFTTSKFYRASGSSTQLKGVVPDIVLPSTLDHLEIGEAFMENPMPWDTIETTKFDKLDRVQPYLGDLRSRSSARVASSKDFHYVEQDIEQVTRVMSNKSISLNEATRLKEKEVEDARRRARTAELKARKPVKETVYDITLKLADQPGLPLPVGKTNLTDAARSPEGTNKVETVKVPDSKNVDIDLDSVLDGGDADSDDDKVQPVDAELVEAEHILMDYIALLNKESVLANHHVSDPAPQP